MGAAHRRFQGIKLPGRDSIAEGDLGFPSLVNSPGNLRESKMAMACPVTYQISFRYFITARPIGRLFRIGHPRLGVSQIARKASIDTFSSPLLHFALNLFRQTEVLLRNSALIMSGEGQSDFAVIDEDFRMMVRPFGQIGDVIYEFYCV